MIRAFAISATASALFALPVMAEGDPVIFDVPPGVLIFDAEPADAAEEGAEGPVLVPAPLAVVDTPAVIEAIVIETVPAAMPVPIPTATQSASIETRGASDPILIIDMPAPVADTGDVIEIIPPVAPAPVTTAAGSASASLRSASDPIVILNVPAPQTVPPPVSLGAIPAPETAYTLRRTASPSRAQLPRKRPEPKVDPVTGRLRDTPGWTGRTDAPASIGCFPEGACAVLNQR